MKKLFLSLFCFTIASAVLAQLASDQNPNYEISRTKYMAAKDSLLGTQSTTVQNTYKAYDWMQLRQERKDTRFQNRQQRRLNRSLYDGYYGYDNYYPYGSYNFNYNRGGYNSGRYYRSNYTPYRSSYNHYNPDISRHTLVSALLGIDTQQITNLKSKIINHFLCSAL